MSYNHLGNNDRMNLSMLQTLCSNEISMTNIVDDMVNSNVTLFAHGEHLNHVIVASKDIINVDVLVCRSYFLCC